MKKEQGTGNMQDRFGKQKNPGEIQGKQTQSRANGAPGTEAPGAARFLMLGNSGSRWKLPV